MEFWQSFAPAIKQHADASGNGDFFSFGEVYDVNPTKMSSYTTEGGLQATLDFGFQNAAQQFALGKRTDELSTFFASDDWYTDADSNAYSLPTFLGNHDMGRIGHLIKRDAGPKLSADELFDRDQLAHSLMYLTRGQPVVYYGDEQGFVGDGNDQLARQDMFPSQVGVQRRRPHRHLGATGLVRTSHHATRSTVHLRDLSRAARTEHPDARRRDAVRPSPTTPAGSLRLQPHRPTPDDVEYVVGRQQTPSRPPDRHRDPSARGTSRAACVLAWIGRGPYPHRTPTAGLRSPCPPCLPSCSGPRGDPRRAGPPHARSSPDAAGQHVGGRAEVSVESPATASTR
jgi:hypothetical protein